MRFDSYHPTINFIYFVSVITCSLCFDHPIFLVISFTASFVYSVKLIGKKAFIFNSILIPLIGMYALWYSYYNHFGVTNLRQNIVGNQITLESLIYGIVLGVIIASVLMWFSCIHKIVSSDKVIYLFGRVSPKLSLFISILLRMVPRIKQRARTNNIAQQCIGRGINQGNIFRRMKNMFRQISILVSWITENLTQSSDSMRSRGYTLKKRTAFSIYRFDNRDRSFVIILFICLSVVGMGVLLDQTTILYNPEIIINRITPLSMLFYCAYTFFSLLPFFIQIYGEIRLGRLQRKMNQSRWQALRSK